MVGPLNMPEFTRELKDQAEARGVSEAIRWEGFVETMAPYYRAADVLALPSKSEGLPNAVLEAMASGLPVVATAISGIADVVEDGTTGRLVAPDTGPVAEALEPYLTSEPQRDEHGAAGRRKVESEYSTQAVLDQHEALFRRIMAGQPAADTASSG